LFSYFVCFVAKVPFSIFAGAVKDSVVGEERIAKYLLSLLNIRKTPLHWERLLHRREEFDDEECSSNKKDSRGSQWRKRRLNNSDALYIQVLTLINIIYEYTGHILLPPIELHMWAVD
jgi:mitochondrial GTPase 1